MPRRPMDSSCLWLPPDSPGCSRCWHARHGSMSRRLRPLPRCLPHESWASPRAQNREIASVLHDASSSNRGFKFFPPCWPNWLPTGLLGSA